jgi:hypothetical protein
MPEVMISMRGWKNACAETVGQDLGVAVAYAEEI